MASTLNKTYSIKEKTVLQIKECADLLEAPEAYALRKAVEFYHKHLTQQDREQD